ncbi:MAG: hypothetical protein ACREDJ_05725, partial [Methylocella sp.]
IIMLLGVALIACAISLCLSLVYDYRVKDKNINIELFIVITIYRIQIAGINSIGKVTWWKLGHVFTTLRIGNVFSASVC